MDAQPFNVEEVAQGHGVETPVEAEVDADSTVISELQKKEVLLFLILPLFGLI